MDTDETRILASGRREPNGQSGDWGCDLIAVCSRRSYPCSIRVNPWLWSFSRQRLDVVPHVNPPQDLAPVAEVPREGPKSTTSATGPGGDTTDDVNQDSYLATDGHG